MIRRPAVFGVPPAPGQLWVPSASDVGSYAQAKQLTAPSDPVTASGATVWFDAHDGSGLQQVPSRIGTSVVTLGSTSGSDTNDPTWQAGPPIVWSCDATDDYLQSNAPAPNINATTGKHTFIVGFVYPPGNGSNGWLWTSGSITNKRFGIYSPNGGSQVAWNIRGTTTNVQSVVQVSPTTSAGTKTVWGGVVDTGIAKTYIYQGSTGAFGTPLGITGCGTIDSLPSPRYSSAGWITAPFGAKLMFMVEWQDQAVSQDTLDAVSAYLLGTF